MRPKFKSSRGNWRASELPWFRCRPCRALSKGKSCDLSCGGHRVEDQGDRGPCRRKARLRVSAHDRRLALRSRSLCVFDIDGANVAEVSDDDVWAAACRAASLYVRELRSAPTKISCEIISRRLEPCRRSVALHPCRMPLRSEGSSPRCRCWPSKPRVLVWEAVKLLAAEAQSRCCPGERTNASRPSRGGRLMVTPICIKRCTGLRRCLLPRTPSGRSCGPARSLQVSQLYVSSRSGARSSAARVLSRGADR